MSCERKKLVHASFQSGIDGPALAASWLGWEQAFYGDINELCLLVLKYYYPNARQYGDIRKTNLYEWYGKIDVFSAGFPCQPFSVAGDRTGENHDSYLWPENLRLIEQFRPRWFIGENVDGITSMVFPGMETQMDTKADLFGAQNSVYERVDRYIIERICQDLEQIGYEVYPVVIPACAVGAPHKRMRCFFIAHTTDTGFENVRESSHSVLSDSQTTYTASQRLQGNIISRKQQKKQQTNFILENTSGFIPNWRKFPSQSPICSRNDGFPGELSGISFSGWATGSIEALGNAIVPQQILEIYRLIDQIENLTHPRA